MDVRSDDALRERLSDTLPQQRMFTDGRNCWRIVKAQRVAFLIDSAVYFASVAAAAEQA